MSINIDWFQAQSSCAAENRTLTTNRALSSRSYWTARYQRISHWIKIIGCFHETDVKQHAAVRATLENSSAGYCQEICMESNMSIFAIKNITCLCLRKLVTGSDKNASKCNFTCPNNIDGKFTKECGGETAFNVFESKKAFSCSKYLTPGDCVAIECINAESSYFCPNCTMVFTGLCQAEDFSSVIKDTLTYHDWENTMETCKEDHFGYLLGNLLLSNASSTCNRINNIKGGLRWIGVAKQKYQGIDRGNRIDTEEKVNFIKCEKCQSYGCSFVNCNHETQSIFCSDKNFSTYPPPSMTTKSVTATETTKPTAEVTATTRMTTRTQFTHSSPTITVTDTTGRVDLLKNSTLNLLQMKTGVPEISAIVVPIIIILLGISFGGTGFILWRQRKATRVNRPENPPIYLTANQIENEHVYNEGGNISNRGDLNLEPKSYYEEIGNGVQKAENPYTELKEREYDNLEIDNCRR
ncbi:uncharacterized protein LOC134232936 isoform X2 [Saccostrea cucullata]